MKPHKASSYSCYHCTICFSHLCKKSTVTSLHKSSVKSSCILRKPWLAIRVQGGGVRFAFSAKAKESYPAFRANLKNVGKSKRELGCFSGKSDWNQHHQLTFGQVWPEKLMAGAFPHLLTTALLIYNAHRWACKDKYKHKNIYKKSKTSPREEKMFLAKA